jgi:signal transduction histidine kinase/ActR/RegA family two-component response regulator
MYGIYEDPVRRDEVIAGWRNKGFGRDEVEWRLPGGRRIHVSLSGRMLERHAEVFEVFVEDITERKRLEAEFHHKRKMEAIGRLAGGVAHDLNNWLTVIIGYAELMLDDAAEAAARDGLNEILSASRAATGITRNLLTFSRKQVLQLQTVDLNQVVAEFHQLVERIIGEHISIEMDAAAEPLPMKADPTQIQQVLMNLAVNSRDAMPSGGSFIVRTRRTLLEDNEVSGARVPAGAYALVVVADTGVGMSADVRERLFEPFFTTKEAGRGTGLGMAVVYGVVKQLGGYIIVDSELGRGTTFTMYFPLAAVTEAAVVNVPDARRGALVRDGSRTRVLLVEDEEPVRTLTKRILDRAGYDVIAAANGEEALAIFERASEPIGLVLTDVVMPGVSGPEMLARMLRVRPVPALLMSGYPDQGDVFAASSPFRIIAKPFTADVLTAAVRDTLERAVSGGA